MRTGGEYKPKHVAALAQSLLRYNPGATLECITDSPLDVPGVRPIPMLHRWPGWWAKLELFRPGLFDSPTLYLDLDTIVIGRIEVEIERFSMLADVYRPHLCGSGVMAWRRAPTHLYKRFAADPERYIQTYRSRERWGDQGYISEYLGIEPDRFGDAFRSYKAHCGDGIPEGARVIYFHGTPRPWQIDLDAFLSGGDYVRRDSAQAGT